MKSVLKVSTAALLAILMLATATFGLLSLLPQSPLLAGSGLLLLLVYVGWETSRRATTVVPRVLLFVGGVLGAASLLGLSVWFLFNVLAPGS
jgi:hypothetical protein